MGCALIWFRRDLRLSDHLALDAARHAGLRPIPVYIHAPEEDGDWPPGAASRAWLRRALAVLSRELGARGSALVVRRGESLATLRALIAETGAEAVYWHRLYEPAAIARDTGIKQALLADGVDAQSFNGALIAEPWTVATGSDAPYRVFTPFWKNARQRLADLGPPIPAPAALASVPTGLKSASLDDLSLAPAKHEPRWDAGFWEHWVPGDVGAGELLDAFIEGAARGYKEQRNHPDRIGTSRLSAHLHFGEISPRQICARLDSIAWPASTQPDIDHFLSELGWREFSHHLLYHFPHTVSESLNPRFTDFDWADPDPELLAAWQHGRTGIPIVDAGMRELWATGWMHNRVRMIVASVLTKNLRYHWRHGARWFWDTLVDADLANNTQGWQWTAGTGADAAPYFRVFNPALQAARFDAGGSYIRRWVPELAALPTEALAAPWERAGLLKSKAPDYPSEPIIDLKTSRDRALAAYSRVSAG